VKNVMIVDGAANCSYDVFAMSDDDFDVIFPDGTDIAFIEEVGERESQTVLDPLFRRLWACPVLRSKARGIHGILFYELAAKMRYYPTRRDSDLDASGRSVLVRTELARQRNQG